MAALPPNNTDRYFFHYQNAVHNHTVAIRTQDGASEAVLIAAVQAWLTALTGAYHSSAGLGADFQAAGTDFTVPSSNSGWAGITWGSGTANIESDSIALNFQGRSAGGHKVRLGFFGYKNTLSEYRITEAESSTITDVVDILQGTTGCFAAIDGLIPTWYGYANVKANDYWVGRARE